MRQIGTLPDEEQARCLGDFLLSQGIFNDVEPSGTEWTIWVHDDRYLHAAEEHLRCFREDPSPYVGMARQARRVRTAQEEDNRRAAEQVIDVRTERQRRAFAPRPATSLLLVSSLAVAVFTRMGEEDNLLRSWLFFGRPPAEDAVSFTGFERILAGEVWRLFTPMLLHFGFFHLLFNMYWLYFLGGQIEAIKRTGFFALLVLVTAGFSGIAQNLASGPFFGGMSGVNYGLFGYVWMKEKLQPGEGFVMGPANVVLMIAWLFLCMTGAVGPIANTAHVVGLLIGLGAGAGPYLAKRLRGPGE